MSAARLSPPLGPLDHVRGPASAVLTLVEFGDYECPHCGAAQPIVEALRARLGASLRLAFRHFPLAEQHRHAVHAAEAAEAAAAQGPEAFWAMHDRLLAHQHALGDRDLVAHARALGLDADAVARALRNGTYRVHVAADFRSGLRSGVNGTPTFFVNGIRYDGVLSVEALATALLAAGAAA